MNLLPTPIPDLILIEPTVHGDERGFFMESYHEKQYIEAGITSRFVQDNHSGSRQGILRGLHFQIQQPQGKLLRVVMGEIYDVAVDLRKSSPTFKQWFGCCLSAQNKRQFWVPVGFAHGFYVLSEWAEVLYKTTDFYAPEYERSLIWNDPEIGVTWPLLPGTQPSLSNRDALGKPFSQIELYP
jgi:dTDP-4-dehydrorhamnose 3,5-epimerase